MLGNYSKKQSMGKHTYLPLSCITLTSPSNLMESFVFICSALLSFDPTNSIFCRFPHCNPPRHVFQTDPGTQSPLECHCLKSLLKTYFFCNAYRYLHLFIYFTENSLGLSSCGGASHASPFCVPLFPSIRVPFLPLSY